MNTQYKNNLKAVMNVCKNYTDTQIIQAKEEIYWHIGEYSVTTSDDNTSASVKTVPSNATRCKIKRVYGNSVKYAPSTASDNTVAKDKSIPSNTYSVNIDSIGGMSYKSENLIVIEDVAQTTTNGITYSVSNGVITIGGTATSNTLIYIPMGYTTIVGQSYAYNQFTKIAGYSTNLAIDNSTPNQTNILARNGTTTSNTLTTNYAYNDLYFYIENGTTISTHSFTPMLVSGTTAPSEWKEGFEGIRDSAVTSVVSKGFNIWDEQWEQGGYDDNGGTTSIQTIRSKNYISILPNTDYYFRMPNITNVTTRRLFYNINKELISSTSYPTIGAFTTPNNAYYMKFNTSTGYGTTYNNDICINVSNANVNGTYKPYQTPITKQIPAEVQALEGYGWGVNDTCYNYSDLETKKFEKIVNRHTFSNDIVIAKIDNASAPNGFYFLISNISGSGTIGSTQPNIPNLMMANFTTITNNTTLFNDMTLTKNSQSDKIAIFINSSVNTVELAKEYLNGKVLYYELATPVETDISTYLADFNPVELNNNYASIEFVNQYNADMPNKVSFYGTIKENCCAKIVQSRNGSVIKTINFPTQASDGWSAGSVSNVRDFTTNKRETNVSKNSNLGSLSWTLNSSYGTQMFIATLPINAVEHTSNLLINKDYAIKTSWQSFYNVDKAILMNTTDNLRITDSDYSTAEVFNTAMDNEPLYYELADDSKTETDITPLEANVIVVQAGDELAFYDSEDNLVTVPTDLTYRIEVAN